MRKENRIVLALIIFIALIITLIISVVNLVSNLDDVKELPVDIESLENILIEESRNANMLFTPEELKFIEENNTIKSVVDRTLYEEDYFGTDYKLDMYQTVHSIIENATGEKVDVVIENSFPEVRNNLETQDNDIAPFLADLDTINLLNNYSNTSIYNDSLIGYSNGITVEKVFLVIRKTILTENDDILVLNESEKIEIINNTRNNSIYLSEPFIDVALDGKIDSQKKYDNINNSLDIDERLNEITKEDGELDIIVVGNAKEDLYKYINSKDLVVVATDDLVGNQFLSIGYPLSENNFTDEITNYSSIINKIFSYETEYELQIKEILNILFDKKNELKRLESLELNFLEKEWINQINESGGLDYLSIVGDTPFFKAGNDIGNRGLNIEIINKISEVIGLKVNIIEKSFAENDVLGITNYEKSLSLLNKTTLLSGLLSMEDNLVDNDILNNNYKLRNHLRTNFVVVGDTNDSIVNSCKELGYNQFGYVDGFYSSVDITNSYTTGNNIKYDSIDDMFDGLYNNEIDNLIMPKDVFLFERNNNFRYNWKNLCEISINSEEYKTSLYLVGDNNSTNEIGHLFDYYMTFLDLDYETQSWIGQDVDTGKVIEELNIISFNFKVSLIIIIFIVLVLIFSILLFLYKVKNEIDYLTNTYSRKRLYKIKKVVQNADLVFLDLYNFKFINDTYGHNYGDELLRKFAKLLKKKFGSKSVHRFAGDEFIIYLKKSKFTSKQIINNLTSIEIEIYKQERKFEGFRINYGLVPKELNIKKNINDLINIADLLMYDAKKSNKKGNILRAENKNIYLTRYEIVEKINTYGLDNIEPYLQPIIDIQSNKIIGYEALSRLNINGIRISAGMFLRYIKSVVELDLHICHKAMKLHDQMDEDITLHLNISAKSLSAIDSVLMKTDKKIILEILETDKVFDDELFYIEKLIKKGYKFAVDDFGIGNSGMVRIQENYISCVKIDKSILKAKESEKLLFSIKKLVDQLDHSLIVEGVETKEEDALIKKLGVKLAQGFYYNKLYNKLDK